MAPTARTIERPLPASSMYTGQPFDVSPPRMIFPDRLLWAPPSCGSPASATAAPTGEQNTAAITTGR